MAVACLESWSTIIFLTSSIPWFIQESVSGTETVTLAAGGATGSGKQALTFAKSSSVKIGAAVLPHLISLISFLN